MARSLSSLSKRSKTISTTQKITNAMKLVSMSKLQRYKALHLQFKSVFDQIKRIDHEEINEDKETLYIVFFPDIGLASNFTRQLKEFIKINQLNTLLLVGTKGYEALKSAQFTVINEIMHSEQLDMSRLYEICAFYQETYQLAVVVPHFEGNKKLWFETIITQKRLKYMYNQVYEPNYEKANSVFQTMLSQCLITDAYYLSKITEYTIRRIAMEKATESADSMLHDLGLQYNRLRQERITEEISDLMSEEG